MNVQFTSHGRRRLSERLHGSRPATHRQRCLEAWASTETSETLRLLREQNAEPRYPIKYEYRLWAGMIYVFRHYVSTETIQLITTFSHQSPESTLLYQEFNQWAKR